MYFDPWPSVLKLLRGRTDLTQDQVADRVGVTTKTVNMWENGKARTNRDREQQVYEALGFTNEQVVRAHLEVAKEQLGQEETVSSLEHAAQILKRFAAQRPEEETEHWQSQLMSLRTAHDAIRRAAWDLKCSLKVMAGDKDSEPTE